MSPTFDDSPVLDLEHLSRHTAGDRALEGELLALFEAQCARLRPLLAAGPSPAERADAAHTLKGSARAIGAWPPAARSRPLSWPRSTRSSTPRAGPRPSRAGRRPRRKGRPPLAISRALP